MFILSSKFISFIKFLLLIVALGLASFLMYNDSGKEISPDQKIVFVLDINRTMNTKDVFSGAQQISRIQAAKSLIQQQLLSDSQFSYGLMLFNQGADYIIPPTFDTWTFLLYLSGITTNLLPDWPKNFSQLSWLLTDTISTSYLIISDFDAQQQSTINLPQWIALLGVWSLAGDKVRYSNGIVYYDTGKSVFSARNDQFAQSLNASYTAVSQIADISVSQLLSHGYALPLSQRIVLYTILWILVILVVFL